MTARCSGKTAGLGAAGRFILSAEGSGSFLKKRTKKLLIVSSLSCPARPPNSKSFCFFFQKEALPFDQFD
jgi:hypothetical protein